MSIANLLEQNNYPVYLSASAVHQSTASALNNYVYTTNVSLAITPQSIVNQLLVVNGVAPVTLTLPAANQILALISEPKAGTFFNFHVSNIGSDNVNLAAGTNISILPNVSVLPDFSRDIKFVVIDPTGVANPSLLVI